MSIVATISAIGTVVISVGFALFMVKETLSSK